MLIRRIRPPKPDGMEIETHLERKYRLSVTLNIVLGVLLIFCVFCFFMFGPLQDIFTHEYEKNTYHWREGERERYLNSRYSTSLWKDNSFEDLYSASWTYHGDDYNSGWMPRNDLLQFIRANETMLPDQKGWFEYWFVHWGE